MHGSTFAIDLPQTPAGGQTARRRLELVLDQGRTYRLIAAPAGRRQAILSELEACGLAAVVPSSGRLIANLKVWENIVLPLAYRGTPSMPELEACASALFAEFGYCGESGRALASRLPDGLSLFERRLVAFVRALLAAPEVLVLDAVAQGLARAEAASALAFSAAFLRHFPFRTAVHIEPERPEAGGDWIEV